MPLLAYRATDGLPVEAFDVPRDQWAVWSKLPVGTFWLGKDRWPAILKRSPRGLQFFAHAPGYGGMTEPETIEHQLAKIGIVRGLRAAGVEAKIEVPGSTPNGEAWQADVLATIEGRPVAIEVQWSYQHWDDYRCRTARYAASNVLCIWVMGLSQRKNFVNKRYRHLLDQGLPQDHKTMNTGLPDLPVVWLTSPKLSRVPEDMRILCMTIPGGAVWLTPSDFGKGIARGALQYREDASGFFEWRFACEAAGVVSAGPLPDTTNL